MAINNVCARALRLKPTAQAVIDFRVISVNGVEEIRDWNTAKLGAQPTEAELAAVDLSQLTADESRRAAAIAILKADVPEAWQNSTNAQQRVAWACKTLFREVRKELREG